MTPLMTSLIIRSAVLEDASDLGPLMAQLGYLMDERQCKKQIDVFMHTEGYGVAIACIPGAVVGFIAWSQAHLFVLDKVRFRIEALIVDTAYRGQGIGKKLIHHLEVYAQSYMPFVIELTSSVRRAQDGTHAFYQTLGYQNAGPKATVYLRKDF